MTSAVGMPRRSSQLSRSSQTRSRGVFKGHAMLRATRRLASAKALPSSGAEDACALRWPAEVLPSIEP
jgi:hypothetical protein